MSKCLNLLFQINRMFAEQSMWILTLEYCYYYRIYAFNHLRIYAVTLNPPVCPAGLW